MSPPFSVPISFNYNLVYYNLADLRGGHLALAIKQIAIKVIALQWIFAVVIFAVFLLESIYLSSTKYAGRDTLFRRVVEPETDRERQPLLN